MEKAKVQETININVELSPSLIQFATLSKEEIHTFRSLLLRYLNDLITNLSIPVNIKLITRLGEDTSKFTMTSYQVNINGNWCRLQIPSLLPPDVDAEELARSVANGVYQNAELFLPSSLAKKIQKKWLTEDVNETLSNMPLDVFHEFLLEFIRQHLQINRAKEYFMQTKEPIIEQVFDREKVPEEMPPEAEVVVDCPYSLDSNYGCDGKVRLNDRFCTSCRRPLTRCPNCGFIIAQEIGFCTQCGISIGRESVKQKKQTQKKWDAQRSFGECISDWSVLILKVLLPKYSSLFFGGDEKTQQAKNGEIDTNNENMLEMMQDGLFYELGVIAPKVTFDTENDLKEGEFRIQLNDLRFPPVRGLKPGHFLVNDTVERLSLIKIKGEPFVNPANDSKCAVVMNEKSSQEICEEAGLTTWGPEGFIILALSEKFRRNAAAFLTSEILKHSIDQLQIAFPALIDTALKHYSLPELTCILRELLKEEFSIRDLRGILETLIKNRAQISRKYFGPEGAEENRFENSLNRCEAPQFNRSKEVELLRTTFKRYLSTKYRAYGNTLIAFLLDPEIERIVSNSDEQNLKPWSKENRALIEAILNNLGDVPLASTKAFILTTTEIRKKLRNLIEKEFPRLAILCYQELGPDLNIQTVSRISLSRNISGGIIYD